MERRPGETPAADEPVTRDAIAGEPQLVRQVLANQAASLGKSEFQPS
jgi:hypothetical protein